MNEVVLLPRAKQDIREAAIWYSSKQKGLGKRFTSCVRKTIFKIQQNPSIIAVRYDDIRTAVLDVFPYMIHYTIDVDRNTIIVIAVFHTSLNPESWRARK